MLAEEANLSRLNLKKVRNYKQKKNQRLVTISTYLMLGL